MRHSRLALFAFFALVLFGCMAVQPSFAQRYQVTDLGVLPGKTTTVALLNNNLNEAGEVVGWCNNGDFIEFLDNSPFVWSKRTGIQPLPELPGAANTSAFAQNDHGQIIGVAGAENGTTFLDSPTQRAVLWSRGTLRELGTLPGHTTSQPYEINNRGQVVGWSAYSDGTAFLDYSPILWENGRIIPLLPLSIGGAALAINQSGQIVGALHTQDPGDNFHAVAVRWTKCWGHYALTILGTLGGNWAHAFAINDRGQVAGYSETITGEVHAFFWERGMMRDMGTLGGTYSAVWDMNNRGQAVGGATTANEELHAALFQSSGIVDLNTRIPADSGWLLLECAGINEHGQISGYGIHNGELRSFLLTPRP